MSTSDFLLEIFSEEIPAQLQVHACDDAKATMLTLLCDLDVTAEDIYTTCSSRRLCIFVRGLPIETTSQQVEKRGPRVNAPEAALLGFLKNNHLERSDLIEREGYYYAQLAHPGRPFVDLIPTLVENFTKRMPWPKTMRWALPISGQRSWPWIRPVRSVLCLWGNQTVAFDLQGWGLSTSNCTRGHRFLSKELLKVHSFDQYKDLLKENFVILDHTERRQKLEQAVQDKLVPLHLTLQPDEALWREVIGLVDWPFAIIGNIDPEFMTLPDVVLSTSMRVHQKYFSTRDADGKLAPYFVALSNVPDTPDQTIKKGFEKVLRARLSDAAFFYKEDLKHPLEDNLPRLDTIVFHEKLGSLGQKIERLAKISPDLERCAHLCKLDLVSHMVGEFDELQGIMGAHYALKQGECEEVSKAIVEHYKPAGANDDLPKTGKGTKLAVIDRLDSLIGFLGVGIIPTGSKDPFALRRAALGILRITLQQPPLDLEPLVTADREAYTQQGFRLAPEVSERLAKFLYERLAAYWKDQCGFRYDIVQSVLTFGLAQPQQLNFPDLEKRVKAVQAVLNDADNADFMALFIRLKGLIKELSTTHIDEALFEDVSEANLWKSVQFASDQLGTLLQEQEYVAAMMALKQLKPQLDVLLDRVQIYVNDAAIQRNRLSLLSTLLELFHRIAFFGEIQVETPQLVSES